MGLARLATILPEENGFEAELGGLELAQGIFTGTGEIANGVIFYPGNVDGCEITRAHEAGQLHRVPAVGVHTVAGLVGHQGGRDDPADIPFLHQIAREPVPQGPASSTKTRCLLFECSCRMSPSRSHGRVPMVPRETTSAPSSFATEATAIDS